MEAYVCAKLTYSLYVTSCLGDLKQDSLVTKHLESEVLNKIHTVGYYRGRVRLTAFLITLVGVWDAPMLNIAGCSEFCPRLNWGLAAPLPELPVKLNGPDAAAGSRTTSRRFSTGFSP